VGENTAISWADHTQNFWVGCTKVSPACDHCYAELWARRTGNPALWSGKRRRTKTWGDPIKWNRQAVITGYRPRIFCSSVADFFDNEIDPQWRTEAWEVIRATPNLHWMVLTKRIGNARKMLPKDWPFPHAG
jgi:protein gp37